MRAPLDRKRSPESEERELDALEDESENEPVEKSAYRDGGTIGECWNSKDY